MLKQMRPNSLLGIFFPTICLIKTNSIKSYEILGYTEIAIQVRRDNGRDESKSHPNNEHLANREHDLVQTGLKCNNSRYSSYCC